MSLRFAYNTNGVQSHRLEHAVELIADAGYDGLALTPDIHHLDPLATFLPSRALKLATRLDALGLGSVVETGARFLLDPRRKHEPTLVSPEPEGRERRLAFLRSCVEIAHVLGSEAVSFWTGVVRPEVAREDAVRWLRDGVAALREHAAAKGVTVALEPEPGHLVATVDDLALLASDLPVALDVGHLLVTGEREPAAAVHELAPRRGTVSVDDKRRGEHVHLPFGEGDLELAPVLAALREIGFRRLVCVELSRDSHRADVLVPETLRVLRAAAA
jgi:D-psicose/D-tagatose/L-ribulose 3-epimerase